MMDFIIIGMGIIVLLLFIWHLEEDRRREKAYDREVDFHRYWIRKARDLENSNRTLKGHITKIKQRNHDHE